MDTDRKSSPERAGNLVSDTGNALERVVQEDLDRIRAESLLARQDSARELTRALEASLDAPLMLSEIDRGLDRIQGESVPTFPELEKLLAAPESSELAIERSLLADLMNDGGETQLILKRGMAFLRHRRYPEALEWWTLNRQGLEPTTSRLSLLLLVMETMTHLWSGHPERAAVVRQQVTTHPLFYKHRAGATGDFRPPRLPTSPAS